MIKQKEFGDFQTPYELAREVVLLINKLIGKPSTIIEPTSGLGNFIEASYKIWPDDIKYRGFEINEEYYQSSAEKFSSINAIEITKCDFFKVNWKENLNNERDILVLGNPPWVTNAVLSSLNSSNLPTKNNFQRHRGFDAKTGKANFDIAEWMIIKLVDSMTIGNSLGMLCKTSTARKVLTHFWRQGPSISDAKIFLIDAKKSFNVSVDACFLFCKRSVKSDYNAEVYETLSLESYVSKFGLRNKELIANIKSYEKYSILDGFSNYNWRSGIKHDASNIMELTTYNGELKNGFGDIVDIEDEYIYPLLKSSDLGNNRIHPRKYVIITQKNVGGETDHIKISAPKTWDYLSKYSDVLDNRKSSIYKNRPRFSIFGIGDYSFSNWKVAVSGLYKSINFVVLPPFNNKPIMVDDTCYFIPCHEEEEAYLWAELLNSEECIDFLHSLVFFDAKRPVTIEILKRINFTELARIKNKFPKAQSYLSTPYEANINSQALFVFENKLNYKTG